MSRIRRIAVVCGIAGLLCGPTVAVSSADDSDPPAGSKTAMQADGMAAWSVDSGGGASSGGTFELIAAVGQPDAGQLSLGGTVVAGGLWARPVDLQALFYDGFEDGGTGEWASVVGGSK